ncbi:MAG: SH3 domain-containing protein [Lachnospiraceae bacterium]|nr:SH3 domain-containing protein [Lachnospiraceae bacterium]
MKNIGGKIAWIGILGLLMLSCGEADETVVDEQVTEIIYCLEETENLYVEYTETETEVLEEQEEIHDIEKTSLVEETEKTNREEYTYVEMDAIMYAKQAVNVRNLPSTDGEKLGGLSYAQSVTVTGQCDETKWYRILYNGEIAYVSNNYLVAEKPVEIVKESTSTSSNNVSSESDLTSVTVPIQEETVGELVWVPTNGGTKYHKNSTCSKMKDPMQVSVDTALANGYTACKRCYK